VIDVRTGDILNSKCQTLVNTVNCVGIMGKGVALAFKKRYPEMFADYVERCERGEVKLGQPYIYTAADGHLIVNFPTKSHWRAVSRLSDIVTGLHFLQAHAAEWGITSIAVPPLGCGNGQLDWKTVGPTLHRELEKLDLAVELYAPRDTPPEQMRLDFFDVPEPSVEEWDQPSPRVPAPLIALVEVLRRIERSRHHWPVGRTRFQKIAYFLGEAGVPTQLEHRRDSYGPYSAQLKSVESQLVNNGLIYEVAGKGRMVHMQVGPTFADAREAYREDLLRWDVPIARVVDLFARMPTNQTEVAATVQYVARELAWKLKRTPTELEVLQEVKNWKGERVADEDALAAIRNLTVLAWIEVEPSPDLWEEDDGELLLAN